MARHPDFRGSVTDVGGPTANMWGSVCKDDPGKCRRSSCLHPRVCDQLDDGQAALVRLLSQVGAVEGVKNVRVASGIRHDLAMKNQTYLKALVEKYAGGQLKLAPEHNAKRVLKLMRKPGFDEFERFLETFGRMTRGAGKRQYVIPYLLSAFPGCTDADMRALGAWLDDRGWRPQQVQCFVPTPGTVATAMYHGGIDPQGKRILVARSDKERLAQHHLLLDTPARGRQGRG